MLSLWPPILLLWFLRFPYVFIVADALMAFKSLTCAYLDFDVLLVKKAQIYSLNSIPQVPCGLTSSFRSFLMPATIFLLHCVCVLVDQSCLTLCNPMDCSLPGSSVHGDSPGKNTGVDCHAFLQEIFPTQDRAQVSRIAGGFFTI